MDKIIVAGYKSLQLSYFFTIGVTEVRSWTIQIGFTAPKAAGRIHTDFEKGLLIRHKKLELKGHNFSQIFFCRFFFL